MSDDTSKLAEFYAAHPECVCGALTCGFFSDSERRHILRLFAGSLSKKRVCDVGCGRASLAPMILAEGAASYTGIDVDLSHVPNSLAVHPQCNFVAGDFHRVLDNCDTGSFDVVLLLDVLEHCASTHQTLQTIRRVLCPGGRLFAIVPNYANVAGIVKLWKEQFGGYEHDTWAPFARQLAQWRERFTTAPSVKRCLRRHGYRICVARGWDIVAAIWPLIYGDDELIGLGRRIGRLHSTWNRRVFDRWHRIGSGVAMYCFVGAERL